MIFHPQLGSGRPDLIFKDFVKKYEGWKEETGLLDFTDFLKRILAFAQPLWPPVKTIFADEVQDFSPLQWKVLKVWSGSAYNNDDPVRLFLAGDDDQAIFTFQGATPRLFLDYLGVEKVLSRTWRLPKAIWEYSQQMIQRNKDRRVKEFTYNAEGGSVERIRALYEIANGLKASARGDDGSWFILTRNRYLLDQVAVQLEKDFIPYTNRRGWSPFDNKKLVRACEIASRFQKGTVTLGELHHLVGDYVESQHVIPDTGIKQTLVVRGGKKHLEDKARSEPNAVISRNEAAKAFGLTQDFYDLLDFNPVAVVKFKSFSHKEYVSSSFETFGPAIFKTAEKITLATIHATKGDEADNVVLVSDVSNSCYKNMHADPEGERRVFYVGATRARKNLFLAQPLTNKFYPL
jgi:DNA helicase-2/ATP-dependent DNA helicase PcrA